MKTSFTLSWRALVRGHVLTLLLAATALVHLLVPALVRSDGTETGWREMFIRAVPGTTYVMTALVVLACACGFFAQERERFRLALTVVRPASAFGVACGKWLALCALAAVAYAFTCGLTFARLPGTPPCLHHHAPTLPSPVEAARKMVETYLADPKTPERVKKAPRAAVLRLLTNKELDRYDVVRPGGCQAWPFDGVAGDDLFVRVRFATIFDLRTTLAGTFTFGTVSAVVSNNTQSILDVKLAPGGKGTPGTKGVLTFANTGSEVVMLRPRRDLELLTPADPFFANLLRAGVQMLSVTALLAAFGLFLSSALSRPVAVFTGLATVALVLMVPSVIAQFPDELETTLGNRIGLAVSRGVAALTSAAGEAEPISALATDTCIEWGGLLRGCLVNALLLPGGLLALAALFVRRKPLADRA